MNKKNEAETHAVQRIDLTDPEQQKQLCPAGIKLFINIAKAWSLTDVQALGLLGVARPSSLGEWETENDGRTLGSGTLMRISSLITIYKNLHICFSDDLADSWIKLANQSPIFASKAPVDYVLQNGQAGLAMVVRLLNGMCQG
jgi:hypothetical protein